MRLLWYLTHCRVCSFSCFSHPRAHLTSTSFCRCCCFFKRKRKKNTPRQKWSRSTSLKRSSCLAQSIGILFEISKVPFRIEEGVIWEILIELFSVFWTSLKTVCWDVQDACVFLWDFFFCCCLFSSSSPSTPLSSCAGLCCRSVSQMGKKPFWWNFAEDDLFSFLPQDSQHQYFFFFFSWRGRDGTSCGNLLHYDSCLTHKIIIFSSFLIS